MMDEYDDMTLEELVKEVIKRVNDDE